MDSRKTNNSGVIRSEIKYRTRYLLLTEAFSQATSYLIFALICVWILINDSPKPFFEVIILSILAFLSLCMFIMFTVFMFIPERVESFRKFLIFISPSDSRIKKTIKLALPFTLWLILFIIFIDGLIQGANRMPDNIKHVVFWVGVIWLIVIPLASVIKLSVPNIKENHKRGIIKKRLTNGIMDFVMCLKSWCKYWREGWKGVKPCWNDGWILDSLRVIFLVLSLLSIGVIAPYCIKEKYGVRCRYLFVDWYVTFWVILIVVFSFLAIRNAPCLSHKNIVIVPLSYRLFEIFQSWVSQYVLGGVPIQWESRNIFRSLVLVFIDYGQVIFSNSLLVFILKDNFQGIICWLQSLHYSLGNFVIIGSGIIPTTGIGYALFVPQVLLTILFLTAAVNRIIAAMK